VSEERDSIEGAHDPLGQAGGRALVLGWLLLGGVAGLGLSRALPRTSPAASKPEVVVVEQDQQELAQLRTRVETEQAERARLEAELREVRQRLVESDSARIKREQEFLDYTQMITSLVPKEAPPEVLLALTGEVPESSLPKEDPVVLAERASRKARAEKIAVGLRSMMRIEQFDSLDLLEIGTLGDGWVGPVVFRLLDEQGRPVGSLSADRLRLEGSRAGWTLTFVLEAGYERRGGERIPFEGTLPDEERGGARRIVLSHSDPDPWYEAAPELFSGTAPTPLADDGLWHRSLVHRRLNELLAVDAAQGSYRLSRLGGVVDDVLRDVEVEQLSPEGYLVQRLVADRLEVTRGEGGVVLILRDGVVLKGANQHAFLEGRYRIFLPRAVQADWLSAGLPGLVPADESSAGSAAPFQAR
jgi:hypothetical protein